MMAAARWLGGVLWCIGCMHASGADSAAAQAAVEAVHGWYETIGDGSDQDHLKEFGAVGEGLGPLLHAYEQLAPVLQKRMDRDKFLAHFRGLAHMRLLQAHAVTASAQENSVEVFVEEERLMGIEGLAADTWFAGFITAVKTPDGWKISDLEGVKPENIFQSLSEHPSWRNDAVAAAMDRIQCNDPEDCVVTRKSLPVNSTERMGRVTIQTGRRMETVWLARLHDGEWVPVDTKTEPAGELK